MLDPARLDLSALADALEDRTPEVTWYLDPADAEVHGVSGGTRPDPDWWRSGR